MVDSFLPGLKPGGDHRQMGPGAAVTRQHVPRQPYLLPLVHGERG